jgi:cathepsin L
MFTANYEFVTSWNSNPTSTSSVGLNQFADLSSSEFAAVYSCLNMPQPSVDEIEVTSDMTVESDSELPATLDWRAQGAVTPIKNQGQCGSCWSFSTTGSLEGLNFILNKNLLSFSEQQLVDCSQSYGNQGCDGGWPFWALEYTAAKGIELESQYPYTAADGKCKYNVADTKFRNQGYSNVTKNSETAMQAAIQNQPLSICVEADQSVFQLYTSGVITSASCGTALDHAILAVGYNNTAKPAYWIVKNSWGASWGLAGYVYIEMNWNNANTPGICGIAMNVAYPTGSQPTD